MSITALKLSYKSNIKPIKRNIHNSNNNKYANMTDRDTLTSIIEQYGDKYIYRILVQKFMKKLQQEKVYNCMDQLMTDTIMETDCLYNRLNIKLPII